MKMSLTNKVEVYSTLGCKYCRKAKAILNELDISFSSIDVGLESTIEEKYITDRLNHALMNTVPQIYIGDWHVGGCSDLQREILQEDFFEKLKIYGISFNRNKHKEAENNNYSTQEKFIFSDLYLNNDSIEKESLDYQNIFSLSTELQNKALDLLDKFSSVDGLSINFQRMKQSIEFKSYSLTASRLRKFDIGEIARIPDKMRLSLFANIYNSLMIHATCVIGSPADTPQARKEFFEGKTGACYNIGGHIFSLDVIEHGILRANTRHPYQLNDQALYLDDSDARNVLALNTLDPRVHFILNCGAKSCPPIKILPSDPEQALHLAASSYLINEIDIDLINKKITLPKLAMWYSKDFGDSQLEVIKKLVSYLPLKDSTTMNEKLNSLIRKEDSIQCLIDGVSVIYSNYDWGSISSTSDS